MKIFLSSGTEGEAGRRAAGWIDDYSGFRRDKRGNFELEAQFLLKLAAIISTEPTEDKRR